MKQFSPRQRLFISEYVVDRNGYAAAVRAGYSEKTARSQASRLLTNANISAEIARRIEKLEAKLELNAEAVLAELKLLGFSNMLDYVQVQGRDAYIDLSKLTREQAAAIQEITVDEYLEGSGEDTRNVKRVRIKLANKRENLELLGKHFKLFTERHEHTGAGGGPIEVTDVRAKLLGKLAGRTVSPAAPSGT